MEWNVVMEDSASDKHQIRDPTYAYVIGKPATFYETAAEHDPSNTICLTMASASSSQVGSGVERLNLQEAGTNDLRTQLKGVVDPRYNDEVVHFRGIPYATIAQRFAKPEVSKHFPGETTEYTKYGPRCPQIDFDTRDFMQIPKTTAKDEKQEEDELKCANLNVTCPTSTTATNLPVFMWIYGGSMTNGFGSAQQRLGDPGPLVAQSVELGKPIILVTIHYRLNIFSFGSGEGEVNLALQDQQAALKWIKANISKFGGDPKNITVGGESAGAIYTHALLASGAEFERAILQSGSLYTSPPQIDRAGFGLVGLIEGNLQLMDFDKGNQSGQFGPEASVSGAPAELLIQTLKDLAITRFWLWDEPYLKDWDNDNRVFGKLKGLILGDTKHEWVLWHGAFRKLKAKDILKCFEIKENPEVGAQLAKVYGIDGLEEDHDTARREALHFLGDARFCAWPPAIRKNINAAGDNTKAYQYYYDEGNPFQDKHKSKAGHAVDLFGLFGGYDEEVNDETRRVGRMMRTKWIDFINGEEPWATNETYVFGPEGMTGAIDRDSGAAVKDLNPRRRQAEIDAIQKAGWKVVVEIWKNMTGAAAKAAAEG
ncbi:hypothetical protein OHC33_005002 [Knufia fluminis]|uniref:Carboxylic ester hydrolase n=1 Tax=Knufia fluminis TaxID=191047 RepID=A0AAN8EEH9_9EURO|nr:hypothetical protein OHC33_005002 [Knufia fluminis]